MDTTKDLKFQIGDDVMSVDNRKLGKIIELTPTDLVIEQGRIDPTNLTIPIDTVSNYTGGIVYLSISEKEANGNRTGEF